jgi:shikimate dehydrogenase
MPRRCAVLGRPIAHSLSPVLHLAAYDALGLDWTYEALEVDIDSLTSFLDGLATPWRGLSLTMPLKRAVLPLLDDASALVDQTGAANTVLLDDRGRRSGHNTDVAGIVDSLAGHGVTRLDSALVLGAGATAAAALAALRQLGLRAADVGARDPARAGLLLEAAERLGVSVVLHSLDASGLPARDLMISTLPTAAAAPYTSIAERFRVVFDVSYDPWPTPLTSRAAALGKVTVTGLDLLVAQAAAQVELMTGRPAPRAAMRAAARAARPPPAGAYPPETREVHRGEDRAH